jgi:hypothetical protein
MNLFDFLLWAMMGVISFRIVYLKRDFKNHPTIITVDI